MFTIKIEAEGKTVEDISVALEEIKKKSKMASIRVSISAWGIAIHFI